MGTVLNWFEDTVGLTGASVQSRGRGRNLPLIVC
jgi:hypothetical protein